MCVSPVAPATLRLTSRLCGAIPRTRSPSSPAMMPGEVCAVPEGVEVRQVRVAALVGEVGAVDDLARLIETGHRSDTRVDQCDVDALPSEALPIELLGRLLADQRQRNRVARLDRHRQRDLRFAGHRRQQRGRRLRLGRHRGGERQAECGNCRHPAQERATSSSSSPPPPCHGRLTPPGSYRHVVVSSSVENTVLSSPTHCGGFDTLCGSRHVQGSLNPSPPLRTPVITGVLVDTGRSTPLVSVRARYTPGGGSSDDLTDRERDNSRQRALELTTHAHSALRRPGRRWQSLRLESARGRHSGARGSRGRRIGNRRVAEGASTQPGEWSAQRSVHDPRPQRRDPVVHGRHDCFTVTSVHRSWSQASAQRRKAAASIGRWMRNPWTSSQPSSLTSRSVAGSSMPSDTVASPRSPARLIDARTMAAARVVGTHSADEAPVDLELIDRQPVQVLQRRVPGTEVVDRDPTPRLPEPGQHRRRSCRSRPPSRPR